MERARRSSSGHSNGRRSCCPRGEADGQVSHLSPRQELLCLYHIEEKPAHLHLAYTARIATSRIYLIRGDGGGGNENGRRFAGYDANYYELSSWPRAMIKWVATNPKPNHSMKQTAPCDTSSGVCDTQRRLISVSYVALSPQIALGASANQHLSLVLSNRVRQLARAAGFGQDLI